MTDTSSLWAYDDEELKKIPLPPPISSGFDLMHAVDPKHTWFVDFQYYQPSTSDRGIYPKEMTVVGLDEKSVPDTFICKSTFMPVNAEENKTISRQYMFHKVGINEGVEVNWVERLKKAIPVGDIIYVKGHAKMQVLSQYGFNVRNMDKIGVSKEKPNGECLSLKTMYELESPGVDKCMLHKNRGAWCTLQNVFMIRKWFKWYHKL